MEKKDPLKVSIGKLLLRTPLMTASGTSGSKDELERLREREKVLNCLGAFVTKGVTLEPRLGNPSYRVIETRTGCLNSIGLQNSGAKIFLQNELPRMLKYELPLIINISASSVEEFGKLAAYLVENDANNIIDGIEINVSCPNIREGGVAFGVSPKLVERIVRTVKKNVGTHCVIITKLTPNVTDITLPAKAAINGGADALSMINTLRGMAINIENGKPFLGGIYGGLSGPAIKPIGISMVYDCFGKIIECRDKIIPIIGIGGISTWQDALEYIMAGATAIGVGTAWFVNTNVFHEIKLGIENYLRKYDVSINEIIGKAHERKS